MTADDRLRTALETGDAAGVAAALADGADPDVLVGRHSWGGLVESAYAGRADIVRLLVAAGATVTGVGRYLATPLRVAAGGGRVEIVEALLASGALAAEPARRESVLAHVIAMIALEPSRPRLETLATLLRLGVRPHATEEPAIVLAVQQSAPPAVLRVLLDRGSDPAQRRSDGTPVLVLAARRGDHAAVDVLVGAGADVDATDPAGRTALMHAVERNLQSVAGVLLLGGADRDLAGADGMTALRLAQGWQWQNIQFALGEMSVGRADVPIARTLMRVVPSGFVLQGDPEQFRLLASIIELVVADLGEEWEERTSHSAEAALSLAGRLRTDPAPAAAASWHSVTATRRELNTVRSALVEVALLKDHRLPAGTSRSVIADLAEDFLRQVDH